MNEISYMVLAFTGGLALGTLFFGGLWITVKKTVVSKTPALLVISSFFFRVSITLAGFYFIGQGNWEKLVSCMVGFIVARFIVIHYTKLIDEKELQLKHKADHEA
jgi:F1F0 ATPase subunit 2